jgi:hypothetical protein
MKKTTLAILALVLVTVATAFTSQRNEDTTTKAAIDYAYFQYNLNITSGENNEDNWTVIETSGNCAENGTVLCVIQAPMSADGIHPDFSGFDPEDDVRTSELILSRSYKN